MSKQSDPVIDEIREVRHRISARFGHDPAKLFDHYLELQKQYRSRLIETEETLSIEAQRRRQSGG